MAIMLVDKLLCRRVIQTSYLTLIKDMFITFFRITIYIQIKTIFMTWAKIREDKLITLQKNKLFMTKNFVAKRLNFVASNHKHQNYFVAQIVTA